MSSAFRDYGDFGAPIATRELTSGVTGDPVMVELGAPRPYPSNRMWVCPYRITGIDAEPITGALAGVDSMQASQHAALCRVPLTSTRRRRGLSHPRSARIYPSVRPPDWASLSS